MLQKILYYASGAPSGIYWCANCRPTWCGRPELCAYWLTQNRRFLWMVIHKTSLHWYEMLAGSSVTKLIGQQLTGWFTEKKMFFFQLKIRGASEKFKNQLRPLLRPRSVNLRQHFRNLFRKTVPLRSRGIDSASLFSLTAGTTNSVVAPARQARNPFQGALKGLQYGLRSGAPVLHDTHTYIEAYLKASPERLKCSFKVAFGSRFWCWPYPDERCRSVRIRFAQHCLKDKSVEFQLFAFISCFSKWL